MIVKRQLPKSWAVWILFLALDPAAARDLRTTGAPVSHTNPAGAEATAWRETTGQSVLCIENDRILMPEQNEVAVLGIEGRGSHTWTLRNKGLLETWKVSQQGKTLRLESPTRSTTFELLPSVPTECNLTPWPLGKASEISLERASAIERELGERLQRDQVALKNPNGGGGQSEVIADNARYLKELVREIGWIDVGRFGMKASGNAIVLAQHSRDLSLLLAILPFVERDLKNAGEDALLFAILHDRLQIELGRKQRYGTQLSKDAEGNPLVLPLEDLKNVEQLRKEIGLPPLAEYLKMAEQLYPGKTIRMPRADE